MKAYRSWMERKPARILAIDDEPGVLRLLRLELSDDRYEVATASDGEEGLRLCREWHPQLVLLDLVMPGTSGLHILKRIKEDTSLPVVVVSAMTSEQTRAEAMSLGADDFISKPFSLDRLASTVEMLLGSETERGKRNVVLRAARGDIEIDMLRAEVRRRGERLPLSHSEWRLLEELGRTPGEPRLAQELLANVWGHEYVKDIAFLRIWIDRLRGALGDEGVLIQPYLGVGYVLRAQPVSEDATSTG